MPYNHLLPHLVLDVVRLDLEALHILPLGLVPGLDGLVFLILPPCSPRVCLILIKYASLISALKYEKRKWTTLLLKLTFMIRKFLVLSNEKKNEAGHFDST